MKQCYEDGVQIEDSFETPRRVSVQVLSPGDRVYSNYVHYNTVNKCFDWHTSTIQVVEPQHQLGCYVFGGIVYPNYPVLLNDRELFNSEKACKIDVIEQLESLANKTLVAARELRESLNDYKEAGVA